MTTLSYRQGFVDCEQFRFLKKLGLLEDAQFVAHLGGELCGMVAPGEDVPDGKAQETEPLPVVEHGNR